MALQWTQTLSVGVDRRGEPAEIAPLVDFLHAYAVENAEPGAFLRRRTA